MPEIPVENDRAQHPHRYSVGAGLKEVFATQDQARPRGSDKILALPAGGGVFADVIRRPLHGPSRRRDARGRRPARYWRWY